MQRYLRTVRVRWLMALMNFSWRYIESARPAISFEELASRIQHIDENFSFDGQRMSYEGQYCGRLECIKPGTDDYDKQVQTMDKLLDKYRRASTCLNSVEKIAHALKDASSLVVLRASWPDKFNELERMFEAFDPVWDWLLAEGDGMLFYDNGGFFDKTGLILPR